MKQSYELKIVRVVAAIIVRNERIFVTKRGYGEFKGYWEFPGGKIEPHEKPTEALKREIDEELRVKISVGRLLHTIEYDYPSFHLSMDCYLCKITEGEPFLVEHEDAKWILPNQALELNWLPADLDFVKRLKTLDLAF